MDLHVSMSSDKASMHAGELLHTHTGANKVSSARHLNSKEVLTASQLLARITRCKGHLTAAEIIAKDSGCGPILRMTQRDSSARSTCYEGLKYPMAVKSYYLLDNRPKLSTPHR